jgi:transcriptional regulator with XRE-family HTH domain
MLGTPPVSVPSDTLAGDVGLRELREERLLSQQELASRAGVSKTTIVNIETGQIRPHPATLRKLAAALKVDPAALAEHLRRSQA